MKKKKLKRKPWEPVKQRLFPLPTIPDDTPFESRIEILRKIGRKASSDFDKKYFNIEKWFEKYDQLYLLSFCAIYFLSSPEGIDPEAEGELDFYPFYLEILQAFALIQNRTFSPEPLKNNAYQLLKEINEIGQAMRMRLFDIPSDINKMEDLERYMFFWDMRNQTTAVRNWAYYFQMKCIVIELAGIINQNFEKHYNLNAVTLIETLYKIVDLANDKLNLFLKKIRTFTNKKSLIETIRAYENAFPDVTVMNEDDIKIIWKLVGKKLKNLKSFLFCHADLRAPDIFTFKIEDILNSYGDTSKKHELEQMFNNWSLEFGELKNSNKEFFILDNPIHHKPFIKIGDGEYFSSIMGILPNFILSLLEDKIANDPTWLKEYSASIKADYLESKLESLFRNSFPNSKVYRGSKYLDVQTGKECENDLIMLIDSFAIIVEAKSGKITDPARRGAPDRLTRTIKHLIEEPAVQANRFIRFLRANMIVHKLPDREGVVNKIDSSKIKYYIPLGITFDQFGSISSNLRKIINAGIITKKMSELAPSMRYTDLECVFELLPTEAEKIHYLSRRREFEANVRYEADEMDLLSFYLETGFNIGEAEYDGRTSILLVNKSKELDPYFEGKDISDEVIKPTRELTDYWKKLLNIIRIKKVQNWIEISYILLNVTKTDQNKFISYKEKLIKKIDKGKMKKKYNWISMLTGPPQRQYLLAAFPYSGISKSERNAVINSIPNYIESDNIRGCLIIGIDLENRDQLYGCLVGTLDNDLFVDLDSYGFNKNS